MSRVGVVAEVSIRELRDRISDNDRTILALVNHRLKLVEQMKRIKDREGVEMVDRDRERWIVRDLVRVNHGPLSQDEAIRLAVELLALTKRHLGVS